MKWVFICGAHSVGKTTLCNYLIKNLLVESVTPKLIPEVARSLLTAREITYVPASDVPQFHALNLQILKGQHDKMTDIQVDAGDTGLCISDRGPLDPICYLKMFLGNNVAFDAMQLDHVSGMIKELADPDSSLAIVVKPHKPFLECDNVRINTTFDELLEYTQIMEDLLVDLNIRYVYIDEVNLHARASMLADSISHVWPDLDVKLNQIN